MAEAFDCVRCHARMEPGYIATATYGGWVQAQWAPGLPDIRWWGIKEPQGRIPVSTMRCPQCGALESFARLT